MIFLVIKKYEIIYKWTYIQKRKRLQTQKINLWLPEGKDQAKRQGVWDGHVHTAIFKMDNQQGPNVQHMAPWMGGEFGGE